MIIPATVHPQLMSLHEDILSGNGHGESTNASTPTSKISLQHHPHHYPTTRKSRPYVPSCHYVSSCLVLVREDIKYAFSYSFPLLDYSYLIFFIFFWSPRTRYKDIHSHLIPFLQNTKVVGDAFRNWSHLRKLKIAIVTLEEWMEDRST